MKNFKKILAAVLSAAMVVTLAPVGAVNVQAATKATAGTSTLKVSATSATIKVGKSKTIKVTVNKAQKAALKVSLKSSKAAVAKVASKTTIKKGAKTATFKITAKKAGKANITVSYKTSANKTVKKTIKVTVNNSETNDDNVVVTDGKITIDDTNGLQTDGTGKLNDVLVVNIPQELGTMADIVWYCDGKALSTTALTTTYTTLTASVAGEYYAIAITAKGTTYKSNTIKITAEEAKAVIKGFELKDDYTAEETRATRISYSATDDFSVATVTLNKAYDGVFRIYRKTDSKYGSLIGSQVRTSKVVYNTAGAVVTNGFNFTQVMPTNSQVLKSALVGLAYQNADGSVTYKFRVNGTTNPTRGTEYVVTFDQDTIEGDTPGRGTANVLETAATAPYLEAPESIELTSVSQSSSPKLTLYGAEKKALSWMGSSGLDTTKALSAFGFSSVKFYGNTKAEAKGGTALGEEVSAAITGTLKDGVITSNNTADDKAFWYAEVKFNKGIYGEKEFTLTSETKDVAQPTAKIMNLTQNKKEATSLDVTFGDLRSAGTVYILQNNTNAYPATAFDPNNVESYEKSASVAKGASTVTIENIIKKTTDTTSKGNYYFAVFVPEDTTNYGEVRSNTAQENVNYTVGKDADRKDFEKGYLKVTQMAKKFAFVKTVTGDKYISASADTDVVNVGNNNTVKLVDQFGDDISVVADELAGTYELKRSTGKVNTGGLTTITVSASRVVSGVAYVTITTNAGYADQSYGDGEALTATVGDSTVTFTAGFQSKAAASQITTVVDGDGTNGSATGCALSDKVLFVSF